MPTAHVLKDASYPEDGTPNRLKRLSYMLAVLDSLGYEYKTYGRELCDKERAFNLETQAGCSNGWQVDFADRLDSKLKNCVEDGDIVVATEAWHTACFRGILSMNRGLYHGCPVIELWIDYPHSFARYRVFTTRYAMYTTAAYEGRTDCQLSEWITAQPFFEVEAELANDDDGPCEFYEDPFSLEHVYRMCNGTAVFAPDWGAWAETIKHGVSGILYRSPAGRAKAKVQLKNLDRYEVAAWVGREFTLEHAFDQLFSYLQRVTNA